MKSGKVFIGISLLYALLLMSLGVWWLYLLTILSDRLSALDPSSPTHSMANLVKWEGGTFLVLLLLLSASLIYLYLRDQKKNRGMQAFYAGMTHELKTPLASVILQSEVINTLSENQNHSKLITLSERLIEDARKLETQMDKILQLGRIEGGGNLNLTNIHYHDFIKKMFENYGQGLQVNIHNQLKKPEVKADIMALELIFKNLIENTKLHTNSNIIDLTLIEQNGFIKTHYLDHNLYKGPKEKLGSLFFKYNSQRGSGIGLYLCKALTKGMKGQFNIIFDNGIHFYFDLPVGGEA